TAPRLRALLERARRAGAEALVADAGRTYFDPAGLVLLAEYDVAVPAGLEGVDRRVARAYRPAWLPALRLFSPRGPGSGGATAAPARGSSAGGREERGGAPADGAAAGAVLHAGRRCGGRRRAAGGGLDHLSRLRPARRTLPARFRAGRGAGAAGGGAGSAVALLPGRCAQGARPGRWPGGARPCGGGRRGRGGAPSRSAARRARPRRAAGPRWAPRGWTS